MGDVYNPYHAPHGAYYDYKEHRHVGDLKMIIADDKGVANYHYEDKLASLFGKNSIVGRGIAIYAEPDDFRDSYAFRTYVKTGNTSKRIACCTIALSAGPDTGV